MILRGQGGAPGKRIEIVTLAASLPSLTGPLWLDLKAKFDGKPLGVVGSIANFGPFLDGSRRSCCSMSTYRPISRRGSR